MKRFLFLAIVIAASLTSCSVEDEKAPVLENSAPVEQFKITATLGSDMTRTIYVDETSDPAKGLKVTWEASESISVIEINPEGYVYEKVYEFNSDNAEGATATFTAPLDFEYNSNMKYLAVYPSLEYNEDGNYYYSGDVAQPTFRLDEYQNKLTSDFQQKENSAIYQSPDGVGHLKNYDAMFSIVEFDGAVADVEFIKLNAVIKWELQFPDSVKGEDVYTFIFESRDSKENHLRMYGQLHFWDIFKENRRSWSTSNPWQRLIFNLGHRSQTNGLTVPDDGKLDVYMPVLADKYNQIMHADERYFLLIDGKFAADAQPPKDIVFEPGKVYVFKVNLVEQVQ